MKDLLSKEHYCYEIHTSLMKSSAYLFSIDTHPPIWATLHFYKKILIPPSVIFKKFKPSYK